MQLGAGCNERVYGLRGAVGKAGLGECSLQLDLFQSAGRDTPIFFKINWPW